MEKVIYRLLLIHSLPINWLAFPTVQSSDRDNPFRAGWHRDNQVKKNSGTDNDILKVLSGVLTGSI